MLRPAFSFLIIALTIAGLPAQLPTLTPAYPRVSIDGRALPLAWHGGQNAPQPQAADLDGDGRDDLLTFDRAGNHFAAARTNSNGTYRSAPELVEFFPEVQDWVLVRDYNGDGAPDLFTYSTFPEGIAVWRGARRADGRLSFEPVDFGDATPQLYFPFGGTRTPIFVSGIDYPAVDDIDGDGDLDILTFSPPGGYVEYYRNVGVENGFGPDTLIYELADECWGGFFESGLTTALDLSDAPGQCFTNLGGGRPTLPRHSGSTILSLDYNGNGLKDVLMGDISFPQLVLAINGGTTTEAWVTAQDTTWNSDGRIVNLPFFPAAFHLDVDQDGDRDILAAPTVILNGEDTDVLWLYENQGSDADPDFNFQREDFFVGQMLDVGTSANVTTFDYDADGDPDLILGNNDQYAPTGNLLDSRLRVLRNDSRPDGTIEFSLVDDDYLRLSEFASTAWAFSPAFGDLDGDGDDDVVLGLNNGKLAYAENLAGAGAVPDFAMPIFEWQDLDAGQFAKPSIVDLDRDGRNDLVVGGFDGRLRFYRNVGTRTEPAFIEDLNDPENRIDLGGIDARVPGVSTGHPTPAVIQNDSFTYVLLGNRAGWLELYRLAADADVHEDFEVLTENLPGVDVGGFANPTFADFNNDGLLEFVVGTRRGGVIFYASDWQTDATVPISSAPATFEFSVFPNPNSGTFTVSGLPTSVQLLELYDATGRLVQHLPLNNLGDGAQVQWGILKSSGRGVYLLRAVSEDGAATRRLIVTR